MTGERPGREENVGRLTEPFWFAYDAPAVRCGQDVAADLDAELDNHGFKRALVVCGQTVGSTPAVMDPVREGLGDRLAGVFAETTPAKRLSTAADGLAALDEHDADVVVAVGGGSSLDTGKVIGVLAARIAAAIDDGTSVDREAVLAEVGCEFAETGTIAVPEEGVVPVVAVPTTLAGADISQGAGLTASPAGGLVTEAVGGGVSDPPLMPASVVVDSALLATTPEGVFAASAMNGFDKGIETLYASTATPITDATAIRGLSLFQDGLLAFGDGDRDARVFDALARGIVLVQYGISTTGAYRASVIHAFGHGLDGYGIHQGTAHGILAPHVLRHLFEEVDGRRDLLAEALGVGGADDPAAAVVEAVTEVRDALGLPRRLRDVDGPDREAFAEVVDIVLEDAFMANVPEGLDVTADDIEGILDAAW